MDYSSIRTRLPEILGWSFEWALRTPNLGEEQVMEPSVVTFYRAMHYSAKRGIAITCRLSGGAEFARN